MVEIFYLHENETVSLVPYIYQDGDSTNSPPKVEVLQYLCGRAVYFWVDKQHKEVTARHL